MATTSPALRLTRSLLILQMVIIFCLQTSKVVMSLSLTLQHKSPCCRSGKRDLPRRPASPPSPRLRGRLSISLPVGTESKVTAHFSLSVFRPITLHPPYLPRLSPMPAHCVASPLPEIWNVTFVFSSQTCSFPTHHRAPPGKLAQTRFSGALPPRHPTSSQGPLSSGCCLQTDLTARDTHARLPTHRTGPRPCARHTHPCVSPGSCRPRVCVSADPSGSTATPGVLLMPALLPLLHPGQTQWHALDWEKQTPTSALSCAVRRGLLVINPEGPCVASCPQPPTDWGGQGTGDVTDDRGGLSVLSCPSVGFLGTPARPATARIRGSRACARTRLPVRTACSSLCSPLCPVSGTLRCPWTDGRLSQRDCTKWSPPFRSVRLGCSGLQALARPHRPPSPPASCPLPGSRGRSLHHAPGDRPPCSDVCAPSAHAPSAPTALPPLLPKHPSTLPHRAGQGGGFPTWSPCCLIPAKSLLGMSLNCHLTRAAFSSPTYQSSLPPL